MANAATTCIANVVVRVVASDMADRPWLPITAALGILAFVALAIWRSAWVLLSALVGAILGAVAFLPVGGRVLDGPADCDVCGTYITVLIGASFRTPYNGPRTAAIGAIAGATIFALAAYAFARFWGGEQPFPR